MKKILLASVLAGSAVAMSAHAGLVNFSYTQSDSATGAGTIAPFTFMGHNFNATPLSASVFNPNPSLTPTGFVGAMNAQAGASDEPNTLVGLLFSGTVTAMSDDGFLIDIPLRFVSKQTQAPDTNDYNWNVTYGDSPSNSDDAVGTSLRFMFLLSRDTVIDGVETPSTFQRYTQLTQNLVAGLDSFTNTDTTTAAIKDAEDPPGAPAGTDAAGRDLAVYFGWRDGGSLTSGNAILVDNFSVGGLLNTDEATLRAVPEPSTALLAFTGSILLLRRRRR